MSANPRIADYAIHEQFINRWSPRAFEPVEIEQDTLLSFFEAARWAASASPWMRTFTSPMRAGYAPVLQTSYACWCG